MCGEHQYRGMHAIRLRALYRPRLGERQPDLLPLDGAADIRRRTIACRQRRAARPGNQKLLIHERWAIDLDLSGDIANFDVDVGRGKGAPVGSVV